MRMLLFLLLPSVLFAQVEVETIIHLPRFLDNGYYLSEFNKLYVHGDSGLFVVDCSTYQLLTVVPDNFRGSYIFFHYDRARNRLYYNAGWLDYDTTVIIDVTADTVIKRIQAWSHERWAYNSILNRLYFTVGPLKVFDCFTDSIIKVIQPPIPGYSFKVATWDSVGNRLFVSLDGFQTPGYIAVYDCNTDSLLTLIYQQGTGAAYCLNFNYQFKKAYFTVVSILGCIPSPGVIDISRCQYLRRFPIYSSSAGAGDFVAVDTFLDKAYIFGAREEGGGRVGVGASVIDCATDSIIKWIPLRRLPGCLITWIPWSNRIYCPAAWDSMYVIDCRSDSVIAVFPFRDAGRELCYTPCDLQLDPLRHRVFALGCDSNAQNLYVFKDVMPGVEEKKTETAMPGEPTLFRNTLYLNRENRALLFDASGRIVLKLKPGANDVHHIAPGVYFIRNQAGGLKVNKVLITR